MKAPDGNQTTAPLTQAQKKALYDKYQRLMNLIPHGKHKNQKETKGAFGKRKGLSKSLIRK